ncbi:MAG TPA: hypothetical protein VMS89_09900 [Methanoregulaceae archaeon]|nr:hypothetical protein [Methanoregulaceae archaeon]
MNETEEIEMKPIAIVLALIFVFATITLAGCSSVRQLPTPPGQAGPQYSPVQATLLGEHDHWDVSRGCYYTVQYQVFNTGNTTARNVKLFVELVHINDNAVRDSKEIFIGTLEPGTSSTVTAELDGECLRDYNTRAVPVYDM